MCQQVQSVTLQTAVLLQVKEFAQENKTFSVHDITSSIRNKAASGELEIPEVEISGASFRFDIPHAKVKALFDELWRTGVFDPDFTLTRKFNNMYFEYTPQPIAGFVTQATQTGNVATQTSSTPSPSLVKSLTTTYVTATNVERIKTYLNNCAAKNFRPTIRNVQSAIKRNDAISIPSCDEIKNYIEKVLGYVIVDNPESVSKAQVTV